MIEDHDLLGVAYTKIHDAYKNSKKLTAFGSLQNTLSASKCSPKHVDCYLNSNENYKEFNLSGKRFPRLKVASYRRNEIWSIDLADMQQLGTEGSGVRYLFVAVHTLSR